MGGGEARGGGASPSRGSDHPIRAFGLLPCGETRGTFLNQPSDNGLALLARDYRDPSRASAVPRGGAPTGPLHCFHGAIYIFAAGWALSSQERRPVGAASSIVLGPMADNERSLARRLRLDSVRGQSGDVIFGRWVYHCAKERRSPTALCTLR